MVDCLAQKDLWTAEVASMTSEEKALGVGIIYWGESYAKIDSLGLPKDKAKEDLFYLLLPKAVEEIVELKRRGEVLRDEEIAQRLFDELKKNHPQTAYHAQRVSVIAEAIGKTWNEMNKYRRWGTASLRALRLGGLLHDIGKCRIPKEVLDKGDALTDRERDQMKGHVSASQATVHWVGLPYRIKAAVSQHHEWFCGAGYPHRLSGEQIALEGRIMAVADALDAKTSDRPYRLNKRTLRQALLDMVTGSKKFGVYDMRVVYCCAKTFRDHPWMWREVKSIGASEAVAVN